MSESKIDSNSSIINEKNESEFFEENNVFINGNKYINSIKETFDEFDNIGKILKIDENEENIYNNELSIEDIKINDLETDIKNIIENTTNEVIKNKKKNIFILENKNNNNINNNNSNKLNDIITNDQPIKKNNYLRNEAKVLEEIISQLNLPTYQQLKTEKFKDLNLNSYNFFKNFFKKEVGKENNYIFNYRDNFLNDMTKIDQIFFKDYFKPNENNNSYNILKNNNNKIPLVYEFSIYHPNKNIKTQQISILSTGKLLDLKNKIYCVLDEIQTNDERAFFFIEKAFYNYIPIPKVINDITKIEPFSLKISQNHLINLSLKDLENNQISNNINKQKNLNNIEYIKNKSKFTYNKDLYCTNDNLNQLKLNEYENLNMNVYIKDITFRIGYPYLFRHIEYCDHMIILDDIRILDKYDSFDEKNVSIVTYQKKIKRRKCDACNFYYAKFISINDINMGDLSHNLFLCDFCLKKLHAKDLSEKNTSNLKIIPYFHD